MLRKIIFLFLTLLVIFGGYQLYLSARPTPQSLDINVVSTGSLPITSTFVTADLGLNPAHYDSLVQELISTGIDTIIIPLGDVVKNCTTGAYTDHSYLTMPTRAENKFIHAALAKNLKIIFGLRSPYYTECLRANDGTPTDTNSSMGHLIAHSLKMVADLKTFLASEGVSWTDPRIAGLYITEEVETYFLSDLYVKDSIPFFVELSRQLKQFGKPIMLSPFQSDRTNYDLSLQAFKNLISKTDLTIIAPQDSLGTGSTTSITLDKDHFRALADAKAAYPTKNIQVWANIETFVNDTLPAPFSRVQQQIEAARPYVSKMTSWIYQQNMMILPAAANFYATNGWNSNYTPDLASKRTKLRADYLATYGAGLPSTAPSALPSASPSRPPSPTPTPSPSSTPTPSSVPADLNPTGDTSADQVNIFDYNTFVGDYGKTGAPGFVPADMKRDGAVNIFDYNVLVANFEK